MDHFLSSKRRWQIGWDEILKGGLELGVSMMSLRGTEGGIKAAKERHDVVNEPHFEQVFRLLLVAE